MFNGKIEGIFKDEGSFDIESQIIPFLSTLKGLTFWPGLFIINLYI